MMCNIAIKTLYSQVCLLNQQDLVAHRKSVQHRRNYCAVMYMEHR